MKTFKYTTHSKLNAIVLSRSMAIADNRVNDDGVVALLGTDSSLMFLNTRSIQMRKITVIVDKGRIHQSRMCKGRAVCKINKLSLNFNPTNVHKV